MVLLSGLVICLRLKRPDRVVLTRLGGIFPHLVLVWSWKLLRLLLLFSRKLGSRCKSKTIILEALETPGTGLSGEAFSRNQVTAQT